MATTQTIAVLVPGITGSKLIRYNPLLPVWPDQVAANRAGAAKLLGQDGITAGEPILQMPDPQTRQMVPVYAGLVDYFKQKRFSYVTQPDKVTSSGNYLVGFGYDWRLPNATTAATLKSWLTTIAGKAASGAQIWLVAHSMGGLVSRYMLETGMAAGAPWKVQGLITLGTPHLGAPLALSAITGQCDVSKLLNPQIIEQVVDLPAYPSGFELLPPSQVTFVKDLTGAAAGIYQGDVNTLLTAAAPGGYGAPPSSFADALSFFGGLSYTKAPAGLPPYFLAYGSGLDTALSFTYVTVNTTPFARVVQNPTTGNAAGDGIVPQSSALFTGSWVTGTPYNARKVAHGQLPNDPGVLSQIGSWMKLAGAAEAPGAEPAEAMEPVLVG